MKKLLILSGVSGAGKSTASNLLEDMGYTCIDQYPTELLNHLIDLIQNDKTPKYEKVCLTISIYDLEKYQALLKNVDLKPSLILIDADKEEIVNRYKFTRRIHPLLINNKASSLGEAIDLEKNLVNHFANTKSHVINTTNITKKAFIEKLDKILNNEKDDKNLSITFLSFGFKNGVPDDVDNVFDVRFLDNPFYDPKLKKKTGKDKQVKAFVLKPSLSQRYIKKTSDLIDFILKSYTNEQKRHLTFAFGCTGGQHRSVVMAEYFYQQYKDKYCCYINHREIDKKEEKKS